MSTIMPDVEKAAEPEDFEVRWDEPFDSLNPKCLPKWKKWIRVSIVSASCFTVTFTSSIYASAISRLTERFDCSEEVSILGLSLFVLGLAFGPMLTAPLSEFYGRRPIYLVSFSFFLIWLVPCAVAQNIQTMLVARFFGGFSGSAFLAVAGGTVVDLFNRDEIQFPMVIYAAVQFLGPTLGPAIGGFIVQFSDWRWCYYALLIWSGALLAMIVFFAPETFGLVLLQRKAKDLRVSTGNPQWYHPVERTNRSIARTMVTSCYRPFQMMFLEPICFCMDIYASLLLGILYLSFTAFPVVFGQNHGFNDWQNGMTFVGFLTGMVIAALSDPLWRKNYLRLIRNAQTAEGPAKTPEPEFRLPPGIFGSIITPIGFFWFAWTQFSSVHWIVPIIGSSLFGAGIFLVFNSMFTFLADAYRSYAASALAGNIFCRCCFAAAFSLFGAQMYRNIGFQWASTLLAFLTLAMAPFPFLFFRYGKSLRRNSKFAT